MARDGETSATMMLLGGTDSRRGMPRALAGTRESSAVGVGTRQAKAASTTVPAVDVVVTQARPRERETGRLIAEAIGVLVTIEEELRERDIGAWTGLTRDDIEAGWARGSKRAPAEGWESDAHVAARAWTHCGASRERTPGSECSCHARWTHPRIERELEIDSPHLANLGGLLVEVIGDEVAVRDEWADHHTAVATGRASAAK